MGCDFRGIDPCVREKTAPDAERTGRVPSTAPDPVQVVVNGMHSIDCKADRAEPFWLTPKMVGVQRYRSLTASEVFPVGAASGARAMSLCRPQGPAGKASKGL